MFVKSMLHIADQHGKSSVQCQAGVRPVESLPDSWSCIQSGWVEVEAPAAEARAAGAESSARGRG